jgi:hypothetical protein
MGIWLTAVLSHRRVQSTAPAGWGTCSRSPNLGGRGRDDDGLRRPASIIGTINTKDLPRRWPPTRVPAPPSSTIAPTTRSRSMRSRRLEFRPWTCPHKEHNANRRSWPTGGKVLPAKRTLSFIKLRAYRRRVGPIQGLQILKRQTMTRLPLSERREASYHSAKSPRLHPAPPAP